MSANALSGGVVEVPIGGDSISFTATGVIKRSCSYKCNACLFWRWITCCRWAGNGRNEGTDYREYKPESKKAIAAAVSTACTIKSVLDTPIRTVEGELTEASEKVSAEIGARIYK